MNEAEAEKKILGWIFSGKHPPSGSLDGSEVDDKVLWRTKSWQRPTFWLFELLDEW